MGASVEEIVGGTCSRGDKKANEGKGKINM